MTSFASMPMYDWPEVISSTDAYWTALASAFDDVGLRPPDKLARSGEEGSDWHSPHLFFSQTCGLPFRLRLAGGGTLLGTPDYQIADCPPGYYRSALIASKDDQRDLLNAFGGASYGYNALDSQSGHAALKQSCDGFGGIEEFLGAGVKTGAHRSSVRAVARGAVEIAAIDAVSWELALRHEPDAQLVKVIGWSKPTPGLPYIAAKGINPAPYRDAIPKAIASLAPSDRDALLLKGFVAIPQAAYLS